MRCSISCCMKLKMASGRRSIEHLLRGRAAAFLYHLMERKKKNTAMQLPAQSSKRQWTSQAVAAKQQTNKCCCNNVISPNEKHFKRRSAENTNHKSFCSVNVMFVNTGEGGAAEGVGG